MTAPEQDTTLSAAVATGVPRQHIVKSAIAASKALEARRKLWKESTELDCQRMTDKL